MSRVEDAIARKEARVERRRSNKEKRSRKAGDESSPEPSRESSETPQVKRRRKGPQGKRKADDAIEETPAVKRKRGGKLSKVVDTLSGSDRAALQKILDGVYQTLIDLEEEIPPENQDSDEEPLTRAIIEPFMKPPPRMHYPDYYVIIQNPIAMDMIKKKINREEYQSLKEFRADIHLLCQNARTYNEDGSILFADANQIESTCVAELKKLTADYPQFADFDDRDEGASSVADGTTDALGADTPSAQPKIKLTFNSNRGSADPANGDVGSDDE